jgi:hypothetical protein
VPKNAFKILGLISARTAEAFLVELANLHGPGSSLDPVATASEWDSLDRELHDGMKRMRRRYPNFLGNTSIDVTKLRDFLRRAWQATDRRAREWWCFKIREAHTRKLNLENRVAREGKEAIDDFFPRDEDLLLDVPPITDFEAVIFYFQHQQTRTRKCANTDCPAPFFFATKKRQQFCSPACRKPAELASKLKWWHQKGKHLKSKTKRRK